MNGQQIGCLSAKDSRIVVDGAEHGCSHAVLLKRRQDSPDSRIPLVSVIVIVCPPGTRAEDCRSYIEHLLVGETMHNGKDRVDGA
jgi:hypothetical protein